MRYLVTLVLLPALLLVQTGCVIVTSYAKLEPQLTKWEREKEYGKALNALGKIDPKDPMYARAASKRNLIRKRASDYEQRVLRQAKKQLAKDQWGDALDLYDEALDKHPKSMLLRDGLAKLHEKQRRKVDRLSLDRLVQHGEWLLSAIPIYKDVAMVDPRSQQASDDVENIEFEATQIANELTLYGSRALVNDDLNTANRALSLAVKLDDSPVILEEYNKLRAQQKRYKAKQAKARSKRERALKRLVRRYDQAMEKEDFNSATLALKELKRDFPRYPKLGSMSKKLSTNKNKKVANLFDAGVSAYSRGQFETAASKWQELLKLEPDHRQAKENLQRAEKILNKLEKLKKKQGG